MPQMGVSVAEGTVVAWAKQVGDWVQADETGAGGLDRQDRHRDPVPGQRAGWPRSSSSRARRSRSAPCSRGSRPTRGPARRTRARRSPSRGSAPARYSPVVQRIAAEHGIDLSASRAPAATAACASRTCSPPSTRARAADRSRRCTPSRPTGPTERAATAPTAAADAVAHAPHDRRAHEALAGDGGDVHDVDGGRHSRAWRRERERLGLTALPLVGARDDRRAARAPGAQRDAGGRAPTPATTTPCTSASPSRWARTG